VCVVCVCGVCVKGTGGGLREASSVYVSVWSVCVSFTLVSVFDSDSVCSLCVFVFVSVSVSVSMKSPRL